MKLFESRLKISYSELVTILELINLEGLRKSRSKSKFQKSNLKMGFLEISVPKIHFEDLYSNGPDEKSTYIHDPKS